MLGGEQAYIGYRVGIHLRSLLLMRNRLLAFQTDIGVGPYTRRSWLDPRGPLPRVDILQMAAQVATLREVLRAMGTLEWPLAGMFAEVVAQVAALLEDAVAVCKAALEEELDALRLRVPHLNRSVPGLGNSGERFRVHVIRLAHSMQFFNDVI